MAVARLRNLRIAPRKARIIADLVRGKDVSSAINSLRFMNKSGSREFFKLIVSAVANAEDQGNADVDNLVITRVTVDQGPTLKRWRPRAQGRGTRIQKKTSHVTLEVQPAQAEA
ncbi:50S ribosomal protein L22 [Plesiocystis pacifica SIR-1]|uniref:Large ribosomal subunit protein uL22 n=1 Tax=Plesiocystis pacifica SIR-1 TaxID=391625 RepID=A6GCH4_9BACT|nr:50S ribosomal protein L22 [Plesiocystis pacifica]EDM76431.1 50S ribosomal protein L22 [Plesiocystis pacifica SIR-1]